ncbi:hypothetical protein EMN47_19075 [Prolixibacteraceae bacterium JC049]|nr:hypothetical protein [Prolixibacteraceae bacterium JC049]
MNYERLNTLITLYYTGEINVSELNELRLMMKSDELPEELEYDKKIILGLEQTANIDVEDLDMSSELEAMIDAQIETEHKRRKLKWLKPLSIAASVLVIIAFSIFYNQPVKDQHIAQLEDTYKTPEEAHRAAMQILGFVGDQLSSGQKHLENINQIGQALQPVNNALSNCQKGIKQIKKILE